MAAKHNVIEQNPDGIGRGTNPVRVVSHIEDEKTFEKSLTASQTITGVGGLMGEVLGTDVVEIEIVPLDGAISYNPGGAAVAGTNARILQGSPYLLTGNAAKLNTAQIVSFSGGAVAVSITTRQLV